MRMRSIAAAALVAGGLSLAPTGAAWAGEPDEDRDFTIVTCVNGEPVEREPSDEERERLRALPPDPERVRVEPGPRVARPAPAPPGGDAVRVVPAEPADPAAPAEVRCAEGAAPQLGRVLPAVPFRD